MARVEAITYVYRIPEELMGLVRDGDYKLTSRQGERYVREGIMTKEILNLLVGSACMAKAREISQLAEKLEKIGEVPPELELMKNNLSQRGAAIILENLYKLGTS